ncbi:TetR/AcrR family transcriptional regulator [Hespellia stercorisuis]|uniref:Transcriptional regulator, TetR family n=1 Tax=Hespellia stercorisuis DSM 15480 TaxID=1121950 RepID=A0A1M6U2Y1_9FIRM|nr:TetR/AcrR family transcriptional regulator [Hespellia stercorisuis]SHK63632.1 transcriptional regulator, TetR family [Hespellia stercorisuis DSM 15480]
MNQREKQKLETKKRIYECAYKLFDEQSFDAVKVADIAKEAGISVGGVYYHFASKDDIIDYGYLAFDEKLQEHYHKVKPNDGKDAILCLVRYQVQSVIDMGPHLTSITFKNQMEKKNEYLYSKKRFLYKMLLEQIEAVGPLGKTPDVITDQILRIVRGSIYDWAARKGSYDLMAAVNDEMDMICSYHQLQK